MALKFNSSVTCGYQTSFVVPSFDNKYVYVVGNSNGQVAKIDANTNTLLSKTAVGSYPYQAVLSKDNSTLWTTLSGGNAFAKLNTSTLVNDQILLPTGSQPRGVALSPDDAYLWFASFTDNKVYKVSTISPYNVVSTYDVGAGPTNIVMSPDGSSVWTANLYGSSVSKIDVNSGSVVSVSVGSSSENVVFSPDGTIIWVATNSNKLYKINALTTSVISTITLPGMARCVETSKDGLYVWAAYNNNIYIVDANSDSIINTVSVTHGIYYIRQSYDSNFLWSANFSNNVSKYEIYMVCFKEDTKILTDKGYVSVQHLKKGDLVKTLENGFKKIDTIGVKKMHHCASEEKIKNQLYKCSKENYPELFEDLVITGCHSILVDNFTSEAQREKTIAVNGDAYVTDNKYRLPACVDERTVVYEDEGYHTIYNFALENDDYFMNYGIYANGLLVETTSKRFLNELSCMNLMN